MKKFLIIFSIIATFFLSSYITLLVYVGNIAEHDTRVKSDIILVLGARSYSYPGSFGLRSWFDSKSHQDKHENPCLVARVNQAVSLYKNHYAPKILMSGGTDKEDNINEAETMKKIAIEAGVPEADILMEKEATSTYENFAFSQKIINESAFHSVIIVTEPYHNARAELVASKLYYKNSLSPASNSPCWNKNNYFINLNFLKEPFALMIYKLLNKI